MSTREIADYLNRTGLYTREDGTPVDKEHIRLHVIKRSDIFDNLNGKVVLTSDTGWKSLLTAYWQLFDVLRNYFSQSDLQFTLASLLFLKRAYDMNSFESTYPIHNVPNLFSDQHTAYAERLVQELEDLDRPNNSPSIFSDCAQLLKRLNQEARKTILSVLERFDTSKYSEEDFGPIFDYFLHQISIEFSNSTTPYTPKYLQNLMVAILAPEAGKRLYDPTCGSGGLLIEALRAVEGKLDAKGTEINHRMVQFGYMNLVMNGFFNVDLRTTDFLEELHSKRTYDYIIGDLPLNSAYKPDRYYDLFYKWGMQSPKSGKGYSAPVLFVLSKMAEDGRAVITVSENLLFKGGKEKETRELLVQQDILECVISLPQGALKPYTDAKCSILVLNNRKPLELKNKIKFIESTLTYSNSKSIDVDASEIITFYQSKSQEVTSTYKLIQRDKLTKDLNLSVSTYNAESVLTEEMLASGKAIRLGELVEIHSGANPRKEDFDLDTGILVVKIENLSKDILDVYLNSEEIGHKVEGYTQHKRSVISQECILIARIGEQLKPTYFKPNKKTPKILIHSGLFALIPIKKGKEIDLEYLYYQLHEQFFLDQIQRSRTGAVMPSISITRLKEVIIPYVEIAAQKDFVASQKASIIAMERAKTEERIKTLNYKEEIEQKESHIVKTLVHQLRPTLLSIDLQVRTFKRIVYKYNLTKKREFDENFSQIDPDLEGLIEKPENNTLEELIERFEADTLHLNNVLTSVNKVMNFNLNSSDKTPTNILKFIQDFAVQHQQKEAKVYSIEVKGEQVTLLIHHPSFRELLEQLIINAEKHGFSRAKESQKLNKIIFDIKQDRDRPVAIIECRNNGNPFKLTQKDYIEAFTKSQNSQGSGIGGNYVNRIVKAHGGALRIDEKFSSGFRMVIEIPLYIYSQDE
uniref:N-6 DNA methylase n=1 Tax=Trichocoleus desertorum TaxID=1481672 RepID=UPI0025B2BE29|nr:N-6 DNA methylase [Trichocoleus desertorum]